MNMYSLKLTSGLFLWFLAQLMPNSVLAAEEIDYQRQVRPILADKCYACHGPDSGQRQAELRLDTQESAFADLGGYAPIVPGDPQESELVRRITADDDDVMPPSDHPKQLSDSERNTLVEWIKQGAPWTAHWAYLPPKRHSTPLPSKLRPSQNWIDAFVLDRLEKEGLTPTAEAKPRLLIRRLHFDLIGLPPSPQDVEAFVDNHGPADYERVVDELLRSPHFGERLAMYWLDLVRYADTVGYHGDQDVSVSPYRDYVINAFNANMPFDQFTREQLAGDLLDSPSLEQLVASGYNRLGMMSAEGGVQPEEYLAKYAADRVRTASTVWLGSTLGCAECHDHKFDPFSTKDFYRFAAFFADIKERGLYAGANSDGNWGPQVDVPDPVLAEMLKPLDQEIAELKAQLNNMTPELDLALQAWEVNARELAASWQPLVPRDMQALHGTELVQQEDGSILAGGPNPDQNTYTLTVPLNPANTTALCIEVLPDAELPKQGPGRADNGNFVISEIRAFTGAGDSASPVVFHRAVATFEQAADKDNPYGKWAAAATIDADEQGSTWGWAILPETGKPQALIVELQQPLNATTLTISIEQQHSNPKHTLGRFRVWATSLATPLEAELPWKLPPDVRASLPLSEKQRSPQQQQRLAAYFRSVAKELDAPRRKLAELESQRAELVARHTRTSLITVAVEPREMRVLHRGNWMDKSGATVAPGVPHFLNQIDAQDRATRLDLANWLVHPENPLTARVFVNRLWKLYFGTGLSKVLDDVGSQGELPSHPELLDTLAVEFMESGWDIKHMVKLLVMSQTYRQSSMPRDELQKIDPYNRLLARQSRFRLDAELIRDNALAVSGLLIHQLGGRSAKPYQPAGLLRHLNFPPRKYQADTDENQYRRGVYTHWQRQFLHPAMQAFDAPAREECTAERPRSNTPLAALVLLNDPSFVEAARVFAEHVIHNCDAATDKRLAWMLRTALSREPTAEEKRVLHELLQSELQTFSAAPEQAQKLIAIGLSEPAADLDPVELAAWSSLARAVLNMHEIVTRN